MSELHSRIAWALEDGPCDIEELKRRIGAKHLPQTPTALFAELRSPAMAKLAKMSKREGGGWLYELLPGVDLLRLGIQRPRDGEFAPEPRTRAPVSDMLEDGEPVRHTDAEVEHAFGCDSHGTRREFSPVVDKQPLSQSKALSPTKESDVSGRKFVIREYVPAVEEFALSVSESGVVRIPPFPKTMIPEVLTQLAGIAAELGVIIKPAPEIKVKRKRDNSAYHARIVAAASAIIDSPGLCPTLDDLVHKLAEDGMTMPGGTETRQRGFLRSVLNASAQFVEVKDGEDRRWRRLF